MAKVLGNNNIWSQFQSLPKLSALNWWKIYFMNKCFCEEKYTLIKKCILIIIKMVKKLYIGMEINVRRRTFRVKLSFEYINQINQSNKFTTRLAIVFCINLRTFLFMFLIRYWCENLAFVGLCRKWRIDKSKYKIETYIAWSPFHIGAKQTMVHIKDLHCLEFPSNQEQRRSTPSSVGGSTQVQLVWKLN